MQKPAVAETVIYIDTLASVEISVDKNDKVIDCKPLNQNAQTVVEGINFSGMEVNATVNVILSSMHVKGMIDSSSNSMLVSVVSKNAIGNAFDAIVSLVAYVFLLKKKKINVLDVDES